MTPEKPSSSTLLQAQLPFVPAAELEEMRKAGRPHASESWISKTHPPLFWEPLQAKPVSEKLAIMKAALEAGADPNELDHEPNIRKHRGRPLHCALAAGRGMAIFQGEVPWAATKENLPVIGLLLQYGADPRLMGQPVKVPPLRSAVEEAEGNLLEAETGSCPPSTPDEDLKEVADFYRRALEVLQEAAKRFDDAKMETES